MNKELTAYLPKLFLTEWDMSEPSTRPCRALSVRGRGWISKLIPSAMRQPLSFWPAVGTILLVEAAFEYIICSFLTEARETLLYLLYDTGFFTSSPGKTTDE